MKGRQLASVMGHKAVERNGFSSWNGLWIYQRSCVPGRLSYVFNVLESVEWAFNQNQLSFIF